MVNPNGFYTYAYLREDRTPYYIGKGKGRRISNRKKRDIKPPKDKSRIIFLKQNLTEEEAFKHEKYMIAVFGRKDLGTGILYNRTDGGDGMSGFICTPEHRAKISAANKGRTPSPETRAKMSKVHSGKTLSEEHKKILEQNRVKNHSEESKEKISKSKIGNKWNVGRKLSPETRSKMSAVKKGKPHSPEHIAKISQSRKGKPMSENQKQAIQKLAQKIKGTKWWNNGQINKRSVECPGCGWKTGQIIKSSV